MANIRFNQKGFTVAELNVSMAVATVLIATVMGMFFYYFALITRNNVKVEMTADSQTLLRSMVEELRYGTGVRQSNTITDTHAPPGGWNTNNDDFVIIIAMPAQDGARNYIIDTDTGLPYNNEYVYYKKDKLLYKRVLANTDAINNSKLTTCPADIATSSCPADIKLIERVDNVGFDLYDQDNNATTEATLARSINIKTNLSQKVFGQLVTANNNMRITLRNSL